MNYVGQLAGQVFVQVKELYRGLNPATLSGCIDVIVVRQPDGSLQCSPFHVRFGKMGVLRSREKVVDIEVNGEPVSLHMKLGENGEAFFVKETENTLEIIPSYLATSPIMSVGEELMESQLNRNPSQRHDIILGSSLPVQNLGPQTDGGMSKKRRKRRRRVWPDGGGGRRNDSEQSEDEDMFTIDLSSDEDSDITRYIRVCPFFMHIPLDPFSVSVCSFSTLIKDTLSIHPPCGLSISCPQQTFHLPSISPDDSQSSTPKSDSEISNQKKDNPEMLWTWGELPQAAQVITTIMFKLTVRNIFPLCFFICTTVCHIYVFPSRPFSPRTRNKTLPQLCQSVFLTALTSEPSITVKPPLSLSIPMRRNDSPSKKKEKRSQHLGTDGVYLDDITELEPEVAALYFPKSDGGSSSVKLDSDMMMCVRSENHSPQSVGSSGMDSGVDSLPDHFSDLPHVAISLCGGLTDNKEITREQFQQRAVSYQQFSENPSIIDDPNLVVKIGNKYYNWNTAAPVMLAMQVYQKPLPQASVENIMKERMPKKGGRWWFSWRNAADSGEPSLAMVKDDSSSDEDHRSSNVVSGSVQPEPLDASSGVCYKKTLRLTSEQLVNIYCDHTIPRDLPLQWHHLPLELG
uniref:Phosphatidate phosphatase n=1 Tax=Periophthalmus magnuspinnatus TaxID=409849 RepID=A0A3B3ZT44_9GOBI